MYNKHKSLMDFANPVTTRKDRFPRPRRLGFSVRHLRASLPDYPCSKTYQSNSQAGIFTGTECVDIRRKQPRTLRIAVQAIDLFLFCHLYSKTQSQSLLHPGSFTSDCAGANAWQKASFQAKNCSALNILPSKMPCNTTYARQIRKSN
jgi:hypothetical protein